MANTLDKVLKVAEAENGYMEKSASAVKKDRSVLYKKETGRGSDNYTKYWEEMKKSWHGQPWCLCWINWIFKEAYGEKQAKKMLCTDGEWTYYTPTAANYFKKKNQWSKTPKVGDIIFFKNSVRICHVGLVVKVDSKYVYTIEGNTSGVAGVVANGGMVYGQKKYALNYSRIAGYGHVEYDAEPKNEPTPAKKPEAKKDYIDFGDKGTAVKEVQKMLIKCGYSCGDAGADGEFGNNTLKAIKKFEKDYKLTVDGVVDDKTLAKLKEVYKQATESVKVDPAAYFNKKYNADYKTTTDLNLRVGAGATKKKIVTIPKGKAVECYGYYSKALGKVWLLVKYDKHTGFCSIDYLKKK